MRTRLTLLTAVLALGLGMPAALAEDAPASAENPSANDVPGTPVEGKGDQQNPGALSAPEKDNQGNAIPEDK
jgi:hypothetical protein